MNVSVRVDLGSLLRSLRWTGHALAEAVERTMPREVSGRRGTQLPERRIDRKGDRR